MILIQVTKNGSESANSLMRRFSRRVQESGIIRAAKSRRYSQRKLSEYKKKTAALKRIENRERMEKLRKLGKLKNVRRKRF